MSVTPSAGRPAPTLRLLSQSGRPLVLRLVACNDAFGPGRQRVHTGMRPLVDVSVETARGLTYLTAFDAEGLIESIAPDKETSLARDGTADLGSEEARRLLEWLDDPYEYERSLPRLMVVAGDDVQKQVLQALGALRAQVTRVDTGVRALKQARSASPEIVVIHEEVPASVEILRRIRPGAVPAEATLVYLASSGAGDVPDADVVLDWPAEAADLRQLVLDTLELV